MKHLIMKSVAMFLLLSFSLLATAQEKGKIGLSYSLNAGSNIVQFPSVKGAADNEVTGAAGIGLIYLKPLNPWLELETGLTYTLFNIQTTSSPTPEVYTSTSSLSLIDIPVGVRANFLKYFFVNGGLLLDLDMNVGGHIDSQSGVGVLLGVGAKYDFKFGGSVFVNPYAKLHSLLPFSGGSYHERMLESGWRLGVTYRL